MDPTYPLFPILFFILFILVLIPLPWHLQAWNTGTCAYMIWIAIGLFINFVNSVVWRDDAINRAPVWCDISSRLIVGISAAIPAASLTINRRLYKISRVQSVTEGKRERRRGIIIDVLVCFGFPCLVMAWFWFVQGHRFHIYEEVGCYPVIFNTPPSYFLIWMWPVVLGTISIVYCCFTLYAFLKRRREMNQWLATNNDVTFSRYMRLMLLASMDAVFTVPLGIFVIWCNAQFGVQPWRGLADAHYGFSRVTQISAGMWKNEYYLNLGFESNRIFFVLCGVVFFGFFGFAEEARKHYRMAFWGVARRFGYLPPPVGATLSGTGAYRTPHLPHISSGGMGRSLGGAGTGVGLASQTGGKLEVYISTGEKQIKRDSFALSSTFSVDPEASMDESKDTGRRSFDSDESSMPPSPDDGTNALPRLTANSPTPAQQPPAVTVTEPTSLRPNNYLDMV